MIRYFETNTQGGYIDSVTKCRVLLFAGDAQQSGGRVVTVGSLNSKSYPPNWAASTPNAWGIWLLGLIPPFLEILPPKIPPRYPGTWHTLANAIEQQTLGFHREKEKGRTSLERCGLICGARGRTRSQAANPHES